MPEFCKVGYSAWSKPMCTILYTRGAWVSGLTGYAPSGPLSLLPGACGEEVLFAGLS